MEVVNQSGSAKGAREYLWDTSEVFLSQTTSARPRRAERTRRHLAPPARSPRPHEPLPPTG